MDILINNEYILFLIAVLAAFFLVPQKQTTKQAKNQKGNP